MVAVVTTGNVRWCVPEVCVAEVSLFSNVTLWECVPVQFQVTVPPLATVPFWGLNELSATDTERVGGGGGGGPGGGGGGGGFPPYPVLLLQAAANAIAAIVSDDA